MPLLEVRNVSRYFNAEPVLEDVSLVVDRGERIGLVGINGSGKTTLCRLIMGTDEPEGGTVTLTQGSRVGYLAQEPLLDLGHTLRQEAWLAVADLRQLEADFTAATEAIADPGLDNEELHRRLDHQAHLLAELEHRGGFDYEQRLLATLAGLGFGLGDLEQPVRTLSGGEKSRLALAKLLSSGCDLLLLDEPTNHLDIRMTEWLEGFLKSFSGGVIVVSHDRWFLDTTVHRIAELENNSITVYTFGEGDAKLPPPEDPEFQDTETQQARHYGAFTHFQRVKAQRREADWKAFANQQKELKRQEEWIRWKLSLRRGRHVREAESRQKMIDKIDRVDRPSDDVAVVKLNFEPRLRGPNDVATLDRLSFGYPGCEPLFEGLSLQVRRLDRLGIIGPNGCGKSSLLKILRGELRPTSGRAWVGETANVGYYHQEHADLELDATPVEAIRAASPQLPLPQVRGYLARFLFFGDDVFRPLTTFSGGERSRLVLAKLILRRPNVLLLDEPTNHLDIASREVLEEALRAFHGTVLVVSHDRFFLDRICRKLLVFQDGGTSLFNGTYSELEAAGDSQKQADEEQAAVDKRDRQKAHQIREREARAAKEQKLQNRLALGGGMTVGQIEAGIERLEGLITALHERYMDPEFYADGQRVRDAQLEEAALKAELADLYARYEALLG